MGKKSKTEKPKDTAAPAKPSSGTLTRLYNNTAIHLLLIVVIGLLAYSNTFNAPFMFDEKAPNGQIEDNLMLRDLGNFVLALKGHSFPAEGYIFVPRRFIGYLTFALNYHIGGLNVTGYHIVNLFIHLSCALLVYAMLSLTFKTPRMNLSDQTALPLSPLPSLVPLFSALLFASHPVQTEAVTYIMQRFASLAALFYLLSLVLYVKGRLTLTGERSVLKSIALFAASLLSALLAMLTKEIAFTLPLVILLYELIFFKHYAKKALLLSFIVVVISVGSSVLILGANGKSLGTMLSDLSAKTRLETDIPRWDYLMTQMRVITTYERLLFLPVDQNLDYDYPVYHSLFTPPVFLCFLFLTALFSTSLYLLHKSNVLYSKNQYAPPSDTAVSSFASSAGYRLIAFGILWFFISLSVESSIIPIADVIFEHRMYLPSVGAFAALTQFIFLVATRRNRRYFLQVSLSLLSVVVIFSIMTFKRNMVWESDLAMWEDVVSKSPRKARDLNNLGNIFVEHHQPEEAISYLKNALALDPAYIDAANSLAYVYLNMGAYDEALSTYNKILEHYPNNAEALSNIAVVYIKTGKYDSAVTVSQKALYINPNSHQAYNNLSSAYRKLGRYDDAIHAAAEALRVRPNFAAAHNNLGLTYVEMKRLDAAEAAFRRALELDTHYAEAYNNLGGLFILQKNYDAAVDAFRRSVEADPRYRNAYINLALAYAMRGDRNSAMEQYAILKNISPSDAERVRTTIENIFSSQGKAR